MGDWDGNGTATPGVVRDGVWYLRNTLGGGAADVTLAFGRAGDVPVVGDWDGNGATGIGIVRGTTWHLRNALTSGPARSTVSYGRLGDVPVAGDWDGNGTTGIGVVRGATWLLRQLPSGGAAQLTFNYGRAGDVPVTGDWDGNGTTGAGVLRGATWLLTDRLATGPATRTFTFGTCGDGGLSTSSAITAPAVPGSLRANEWTTLPTSTRVVALTFDAGGNAQGLPSILDTLARTHTPATFFLTGAWTSQNPALARQVVARYPVGNHSVNHPDFTTLSDAAVRDQVVGAHQTIRTTTGADPRPWFRFPFGARDSRTIGLVNCLGYGSVRWTVDSLGWQGTSGGQSTTSVRQRVVDALTPGEIVLMHVGSHPTDGSTLDAAALAGIISDIRARGYQFVTLEAFG
ncbi:polysaccharide deacetylase family protein [Georgenia yuyongxinii]|uniref:Polysaccharide deacetylase family protein n=2 Tax=Georgenia yuyongxinii TaxID=2589797 RepID=A0A552WLF1_9MICO|nr:polysaccharide deacetylase family protein [Georgenia yuyongxinii]